MVLTDFTVKRPRLCGSSISFTPNRLHLRGNVAAIVAVDAVHFTRTPTDIFPIIKYPRRQHPLA